MTVSQRCPLPHPPLPEKRPLTPPSAATGAEIVPAPTNDSAEPTWTLRHGVKPHVLTREDRQKAAAVTNEKRRKASRSILDVQAEILEERGRELVEKAYVRPALEGDWRAVDAMIHNVHGKPGQRGEATDRDLEPGDTTEIRRLLIEHITVTKSDIPPTE